ncbi:MAG TPA: hypothetical protein VJ784_09955 [Pyrinomonadaceae bacterium]|jgi:hypothetical protein|nr:hypothetical protein [Pyrinomonadaceae bacterium]
MECHEFCEIADSYLSDELSVETNHEAISHLEKCADCRCELSARRALRTNLRDAFIGLPVNRMRPEFVSELSGRLRDAAIEVRSQSIVPSMERSQSRRYFTLAVAACLLLTLLIGSIIVRQLLSRPAQNIVKIELAKAAVGDHRDCAEEFRLAEKPIALDVAGQNYDPVYLGLAEIFAKGSVAPPDVKFIEAHSCVFAGRRFAHIVLKYHGSLVSFLVTGIPSNLASDHSPAKDPATIVCSQIEGYNVSFFQTHRHGIFVVSTLPEGDNLALARAFAPGVFDHITNRERTTALLID